MSRKKDITSELLKQVGSRIRTLRLQNGYSQEELAHRAEIHVTTLSEIECGKSNMTLITCENIANALETSIAAFFPETHIKEDEELSRVIASIQKTCSESTIKEKARFIKLIKCLTDNFN
jgi:transcriptional regulator with XRE-family HTH domain